MRVVKWIGIVVGSLLGLILLGVGAIYALAGQRIGKHYEVAGHEVVVPEDSASLARGAHVAATRGCTDCHKSDLGGGSFIDEPIVARLHTANLTRGAGGVGDRYRTTADWERAIRQGVAPDGRALLFMPSHEFDPLSDEDLGALIAFIQSKPPVDRSFEAQEVGPVGRALFVAGLLPLVPAELVDHAAPRPIAPAIGITPEYGKYLAGSCAGCHGPTLSGGAIPGAPPEMAIPRNITPDSATGIGSWELADFTAAVREGKSKAGSALNKDMPRWSFTDDEVAAIWAYMRTVPAKAYGGR